MDAPLFEWKCRKPHENEHLEAFVLLASDFVNRLKMALMACDFDAVNSIAAQGSKELWAAKENMRDDVDDDTWDESVSIYVEWNEVLHTLRSTSST